jgi:hypothetical protein
MKKFKLLQIFILLSVILFSCSEAEEPVTLVGRWEATVYRGYENSKLVETDNNFDDEGYVFIFEEDGTMIWEIDGDEECDGTYESKKMDSKPQKIVLCGDEDGLLTIKSNDKIMLSFEYGNGEREELDLIRM